MDYKEISNLISTAEKKTPVIVYIKGNIDKRIPKNVKVFDGNPGIKNNFRRDQDDGSNYDNGDIGEKLLCEFDQILSSNPGLESIRFTTA